MEKVKNNRIIHTEIKGLEFFVGMAAAFAHQTKGFEPTAEKNLKTELKYFLDPAECYIFTEKKPLASFEIFVDFITHGIPGLVISREHPKKVKKKYNLVRTPILWLSRSDVDNALNPTDLPVLINIIRKFTRKSDETIVLLNGLEYLISQNNFGTVLKCLQEVKDIIILNNARLVLPLHRGTLSLQEYSILEKEFLILESG